MWKLFDQETHKEEVKQWSSDHKLEEAVQIKEEALATQLGAQALGGNNSIAGGWKTSPYILGMILTPRYTIMLGHPNYYESDHGETW